MSSRPPRRRFSDFLALIRNWTRSRKSDQKSRSFSTGDLCSPKRPSQFEPDFVEMDFGARPTTSEMPSTSKMPPHYDDCDLVPMEFTSKGVRLLPQGSKKAKETVKAASANNVAGMRMEEIHNAQSWFFLAKDQKSSERILLSNGYTQASFLISYHNYQYVLSFWRNAKVEHIIIQHYENLSGTVFNLDLTKEFKNLLELTEYYKKHKSTSIKMRLSQGVGPRRSNLDLQRARA